MRIVVIDDEMMSLRMARRVFEKAGIEGSYFGSGAEAFTFLNGENIPDLILLDVHMPGEDGFEILRRLKAEPVYRNVPVVFLTGDEDVRTETAGLHAGAADFIRKPFAAEVLLKRVRNIVELNRLHGDMEREIRAKTEKLSRAYIQIVQALAASVDAKDRYTHGHSSRVAKYAREIAARAGFSEAEQDAIYMMGLLHDVGKIGISDAIINKAGRLTDGEFAQIKTHPAVGAEILEKITDLPELKTGARWHHERYDGRGYPDGLAGEEIPEVARIIAVADTYDAMTSNRSYRGQLPQAQVRAEIARCSGSQFDPRFAGIMLDMIDGDKDYTMREV
ncbi:MAG: response regulator [Clostridia bacterium]|nr:response regulator [Clostridia bacterium]